MSRRDDNPVEPSVARIEPLVRALEACHDPAVRTTARDLVAALLDMHRAGLARILERVESADVAGHALIDALACDERIAPLLLLHDLHPVGLEARVARALASVDSYLRAHGARAELCAVEDGAVRIKLSCEGLHCGSTEQTLRRVIERAIDEAAPDAARITIEGAATSLLPVLNGFVPS